MWLYHTTNTENMPVSNCSKSFIQCKKYFLCVQYKTMVSSIGSQLYTRTRISGFGRRRPAGRGVVRRVMGTIARPALSFIANKVADLISGTGRRRRAAPRRRVTCGTSYRLTGMGRKRRAPRSTLSRRRPVRTVRAYKRRAPRARLGVRRRRY